jgi:rubrerythrin
MLNAEQWPPYSLIEDPIEETARRRLDKLERIYHIGQDNIWDGREVLDSIIKKHGKPKLDAKHEEPLRRMLGILLWGELAAWAISADLAERIEDIEAKMAATSQAHDEARHFYVLRDYLRALGGPMPRLGGISRKLLLKVLQTESLAEKLVGMQMMVETNALGIFHALRESQVEPVLTELLPYYEKDEARHVGLGVMYLPQILRHMNRLESARLIAFQFQCAGYLMAGGAILREDMEALGIDQRKATSYVLKIQSDVFQQMLQTPAERGVSRRRDSVRGMLDSSKGIGPAIINFLHPEGGVSAMKPLHRIAFDAFTRTSQALDRALA